MSFTEKTKFVKLHGNRIITGKLSNREQVLNEIGRKQNVAKLEMRRSSNKTIMTSVGDRKASAIAEDNV